MNDNNFVDLIGTDGNLYRGIRLSYDNISTYQTLGGPSKSKSTKYYYELEDGSSTEMNRFGEHVIRGTNITLKPV